VGLLTDDRVLRGAAFATCISRCFCTVFGNVNVFVMHAAYMSIYVIMNIVCICRLRDREKFVRLGILYKKGCGGADNIVVR